MNDDFFNTSGASANHTRHTKPPLAASKKHTPDPLNELPSINLQNFESPEFHDSRYILTSPNSLEACARVGVKPLDLIYKGLADYELENPEMPIREVYTQYENGEDVRKTNLRKCREERQRILLESGDHKTSSKPSLNNPKVYKADYEKKPIIRSSSFNHAGTGDNRESRGALLNSNSTDCSRKSAGSECGQSRKSRLPGARRVPVRNETFDSLTQSYKSISVPKRCRSFSEENSNSIGNRSNLSTPSGNHQITFMLEYEKAKWETDKRQRDNLTEKQCPHSKDRKYLQIEQANKELRRLERKYQQEMDMMTDLDKRREKMKYKEQMHQRLNDRKQSKLFEDITAQREEREENFERVHSRHELKDTEKYSTRVSAMKSKDEALKRVEQLRLEKEKKRRENQTKLEQFKERRALLDRKKEEDVDELQEFLTIRDSAVQHNQKKARDEREKFFSLTRSDRERRMKATAERRKQLEAEIEQYKTELQNYQNSSLRKADERCKQKIDREKLSIKEKRFEKERQFYLKLEKIRLAEEEWKKEAEEILEMKNEKRKQMEEEKQNRIRESREIAQTAAQMRQDIKNEYDRDSFNKIVRQAEIYNMMGLGHNASRG